MIINKTRKSAAKKTYLQETLEACKRVFIIIGVFSLFINTLLLATPIYMLQIFTRVLNNNRTETLIYLTAAVIFILIIYAALEVIRSFILIKTSAWLDQKLSIKALEPCADEIANGRIYGVRSLKDIIEIRNFLSGTLVFSFFDSPWVIIYILVLYLLHIAFGVIGTMGAILLFCLAVVNEVSTRKPIQEASGIASKNNQHIDSAVRNADAIQAMGMMQNLAKQWHNENQFVLALQEKASKVSSIIVSASKTIRFILQVLIFAVGAYLVITNVLTPGALIAASIIMSRALSPIEQSISSWKAMKSARAAYERLKVYFETADFPEKGTVLPKPKGIIKVEGLSMALPNTQKFFLKNISFTLTPGNTLGIIGPTAAGKSSLLRALAGVWKPQQGQVRLDGANVATWNREEVGQYIGYLPQDVELFQGTVAQNIARMGESSSEEIIKAAKLASVHEMILTLPEGYDTVIGPGYYVLSGGQQQRLALARAVFGDPCLIILDEPNSNLDQAGENALYKTILELKNQNKTIVVVAHRYGLINSADYLMILENGVITKFGAKNEVVAAMQAKEGNEP